MFRTTMALALGTIATGCGTPYECCQPTATYGVGHLATCYCPPGATCEYGILDGHTLCTDDPTGQACIPHWLSGTELRCFDEGGPTITVPCCEDIGPDGVGRLSSCRCPVPGCEGASSIERVGESGCRLGVPGGTPDADADGG